MRFFVFVILKISCTPSRCILINLLWKIRKKIQNGVFKQWWFCGPLFLKREKERGNIGSIQSWDREGWEFLLLKEQRDYHGLAILEPHIKKKTTNSSELSVQGPNQCFVLRDEVNQLDNRHSGFWRSLVLWLWIVKKTLKMLLMDVKNAKKFTWSQNFGTKVLKAV